MRKFKEGDLVEITDKFKQYYSNYEYAFKGKLKITKGFSGKLVVQAHHTYQYSLVTKRDYTMFKLCITECLLGGE